MIGSDLVARLRALADGQHDVLTFSDLSVGAEAADEIERLTADNERLRAELQNIANAEPSKWDMDMRDQFRQWVQSRARWALSIERTRHDPRRHPVRA